jgi:hypothetical protein
LLGLSERLDEYDDSDPYPLELPGKTISSAEAKKLMTAEYVHYVRFYNDYKHGGNPFNCGWLDWPRWVIQLIKAFSYARSETENYLAAKNAREAERRARVRR